MNRRFEGDIGPQRGPADDSLLYLEVIKQSHDLVREQLHPIVAWVQGSIALSVPEKVHEDDAVSPFDQHIRERVLMLARE
jgi:hypothetical protein